MGNAPAHEIELYPFDSFKTLLDHGIIRSRRYKEPLSLIHMVVEAEPNHEQTQHSAEVFAINVLNLYLRETDIPCREGNEFLVLLTSTDETGGRVACERLERLFNVEPQVYDRVSFKLLAFIGMATLPVDGTLTSRKLLENAEQALQRARTQRITKAVLFSEIK
jgi:PleD family two-component response regulator